MHSATTGAERIRVCLIGANSQLSLFSSKPEGSPIRWDRGAEAAGELSVEVRGDFDRVRTVKAELWMAFPSLGRVFMIPLVVSPVPGPVPVRVMQVAVLGMMGFPIVVALLLWRYWRSKVQWRLEKNHLVRQCADDIFKKIRASSESRAIGKALKGAQGNFQIHIPSKYRDQGERLRWMIRVTPQGEKINLIEFIRRQLGLSPCT
jgi:hypothetical protein